MFTHLKVRTGMFGVLVVFVVALLAASLNGWYGARVSDQQIRDLNLLTAVQLDKLNNAAIWAVRASATSHSSLIDRMSNKIEAADQGVIAAKERLANGQKLVDEILPTVSDPQLLGAARDLQAVFTSYGQTVLRQIDSTRSGDLAEYVRINDEAKATSQAYAKARETFTNLITAKARQTMVESEQRIALAQFSTLALVALTVLLAIGCWWFISQRVLAPLRDAAHHFEVIAAGDLSQPIHVASRNEIGQLFAALAHMQQSQRETLDHLSKTATQVSNAARDLGVVTRDGNLGLQQQNAELEQAASAVTEMTAAVEEVARNAVSTSQAASASDKLATASREQVRKVLGEIGTMSDDVQTTGSTIQRLADQANNIGKVLDVIRSVSEQTNLLALNAAIEAARAGEAGRGFAVVADEVRTLAHRTQQSTLEIEEMIASIQTSTGSAVSSIELSNQRASSTLQATRTSGEMLEEIFTAIGEINERNLVIASAAEEQAQVAREVDRNLLNIRELSSQAGLGADRTSTASQELSRLASEMMSIASRFKT